MLIVDLVRSELERRRMPEKQWIEECLSRGRQDLEDIRQEEESRLQELERDAAPWNPGRVKLWQAMLYGVYCAVRCELEATIWRYEHRLEELEAGNEVIADDPEEVE